MKGLSSSISVGEIHHIHLKRRKVATANRSASPIKPLSCFAGFSVNCIFQCTNCIYLPSDSREWLCSGLPNHGVNVTIFPYIAVNTLANVIKRAEIITLDAFIRPEGTTSCQKRCVFQEYFMNNNF